MADAVYNADPQAFKPLLVFPIPGDLLYAIREHKVVRRVSRQQAMLLFYNAVRNIPRIEWREGLLAKRRLRDAVFDMLCDDYCYNQTTNKHVNLARIGDAVSLDPAVGHSVRRA